MYKKCEILSWTTSLANDLVAFDNVVLYDSLD